MLKFKYDYQQNALAYQKYDLWYEIAEEQKFAANFDSQGFKLESSWIAFTVYDNKIRAFFKQITETSTDFWEPNSVTYYRKDLPRTYPIIFEFNEADQVEKVNNKWVKKGNHATK